MSKTINLRQSAPKPAAPKPLVLPPVRETQPKPVVGPGLPSRINGPLGSYVPTGTLANHPAPASTVPFVTLRPKLRWVRGDLRIGFVMGSGLGPSWSASGVATLRRGLAGRAG